MVRQLASVMSASIHDVRYFLDEFNIPLSRTPCMADNIKLSTLKCIVVL